MKVYPDANVFVALLIDEPHGPAAELFFKKSADCLFDIVVSKTTLGEVSQRLENKGTLWLQNFIDEFKDAKKLEIVQKSEKETSEAIRLNQTTGGQFGVNDFIHALLVQRHADVFVTNDLKFFRTASRMVETLTLEQFLAILKPKPG